MPLHAKPAVSQKPGLRLLADGFTVWNRRLHYYIGLYLLCFVWLFAFSGLLLNHSSWVFAQFFQSRKVSVFERPIPAPVFAGDLEQAGMMMKQLGIEGEIGWSVPRSSPDRLDFTVSRPGRSYQIQGDLRQRRVKVTLTKFNGWGVMRGLHTFDGVSVNDRTNQRDWFLTRVWAFSMDAVAAGIIFMVLSSLYMWWKLKDKRKAGLVALGAGSAVCGLFVLGLRWIYT
jgi:hypothetical protein